MSELTWDDLADATVEETEESTGHDAEFYELLDSLCIDEDED